MFIHKKTVIFIPYFDSPFCLINYWQNGGFFLKSEIPEEKCLREYLEELKDIAVAVAEKVIHISLRSSGSVISRMIEAETEKLQKMDWVKIYMEKEDYETMVQADGHLAEKLSRLSDNVKFIVMEDGKCGSCIIEMPDGIIDMSVDTQLENIHRLVDNANT